MHATRSRTATIRAAHSCLEEWQRTKRMIYNVLVAEADNDTWTSIASGVRRYQQEAAIVRVKDGEQAVRYLFQRGLFTEEPETPHLVVLAAELSIVSADAVIERLRQHPRTEAIPVIVIRQEAARNDLDDTAESEQCSLSRGVVVIFATERLDKQVASALSRLHWADAPMAASVPCNLR
jgi:CheY-like chemotaxis protein